MPVLYYVHDPMCSWCWAFRPTLLQLRERLPDGIGFSQLLGGLAADSDEPMPEAMQQQIQATWRRIQQKLPETRFNFDFWQVNQPRRSTYPACRAVIAARQLDPDKESTMILAIQEAYYLDAKNPSDDETLLEIAVDMELDAGSFQRLLNSADTQASLMGEIQQSRSMGVHSFPSLILQQGKGYWPVPVDYLNADSVLETIELLLD